jgi:hypothetical protein
MYAHSLFYWLKNILGGAMIVAAIWLVAFFDTNHSSNLLLNKYHLYFGCAALFLGVVLLAGVSNVGRIFGGFVLVVLGMVLLAYFMPQRSTWIGQLATNFGGPALMLFGLYTAVCFDTDLTRRRR